VLPGPASLPVGPGSAACLVRARRYRHLAGGDPSGHRQRPVSTRCDARPVTASDVTTFDMIADERRAMADLLDELSVEQLTTASLCTGWRVHDVAAHVVMVLEISPGEFLRTLVTKRGSFDRANTALTAKWAKRSPATLAEDLRRLATSRFTPPGEGPAAPLSDHLVHDLDIRRPLGIDRPIPTDRLRIALDFLVAFKPLPGAPGPTLVPKGLLDGLRLEADDIDWSHGRGAQVQGAADDVLLAITGRPAGAQRLTGAGAGTLTRRLRTAR
jgi:uncharacterized protein (TIGR03083 family)